MRWLAPVLAAALAANGAHARIRFVVDDPAMRARRLTPASAVAGGFVHSHSYVVMRSTRTGALAEEVHVLTNHHAARHLQEVPTMPGLIPAPLTRREQLVTAAEIMIGSFPDPAFDIGSLYQPFYDAGVPSRFANTTSATAAADTELRLRYSKRIRAEVRGRFSGYSDAFLGSLGGRTRSDELGVACDVYTSASGSRVMHFRGSYSDLDFLNIRALYGDWFGAASRERYRELWETEAKLPVTQAMKDRVTTTQTVQDYAVRMEFNLRMSELVGGLRRGLELGGVDTSALGITAQGVSDWGMWELTRAIVRREVPAGSAANASAPLYITGYSQGGARAQLASLLLAHEDGVRYNTTTLAATGVQCASQSLFLSGRSMADAFFGGALGDHADHIVTYTHVLDPYAAIDFSVGTRCTYGVRDAPSSFVRDFCKDVVGYSLGSATALHSEELALCVFSTHNKFRILSSLNLSYTGYLGDDGVTDGGCKAVPDQTASCQLGPPPGFIPFVLFVIALPSAVVGLALLALGRVLCLGVCRCVCRPAEPKRTVLCCFVVSASDSVVPWLCCNGGPQGETKPGGVCSPPTTVEEGMGDGWCVNRYCCCCGRACCCFGVPCCPPPPPAAGIQGSGKPAGSAVASTSAV